jgi:hypothetical protein
LHDRHQKYTLAELADLLGWPVTALNAIVAKRREAIDKPFYTITQLKDRWGCSRAQVYTILREAEYKAFNVASKASQERQHYRISAAVIKQIEQSGSERIPEVAA